MKNNQKDIRQDIWDKDVEKALAKEAPELLLDLKKSEIKSRLPSTLVSAPFKLFLFVMLVDIIVAAILSIIIKRSHFNIFWA